MTAYRSCPGPLRLSEFLDGVLADDERDDLAGHLEDCGPCQQALERLTAVDERTSALVRSLERGWPPPEPALDRLLRDPPTVAFAGPGDTVASGLPFLSPSEHAGHLGRIGSYEVLRLIGRGGMGVVLKALDPALNRFVAIKVLAPHWCGSDAARQRFAREARATAAVRHEHVVAVHAVEEAGGVPYLVMEYVAGPSLQEELDRHGPPETAEAVRIGMQVALGLAAAHAEGLVHRDVKPGNILLEEAHASQPVGLRVKLVDFGLARAVDDASLTQSGVIAGTPHYMAPEQARGEEVDARADLFSLGAVLYALCTGQPPFGADSTLAVLRRVCEDSPRPIHETNPRTPDWLVAVVDRLLCKRPGGRFRSAAVVAQLLQHGLAHLRDPACVPAPRVAGAHPRRRLWLWAAAAAALLALVPLGIWLALGAPLPFGPRGGAPDAGPVPQVQARQQKGPWVVLSNGRITLRVGQSPFRVDYRFVRGAPAGAVGYYLVVCDRLRPLPPPGPQPPWTPAMLSDRGTLPGQVPLRPPLAGRSLECHLEADVLVDGQGGVQRVRVSDPIPLMP